MPSTLNLSLTDELRAFIDANCGDGTLYATPSEFVRDVLEEQASSALEHAMYVVNTSRRQESRIVVDLALVHR